MTINAVVQWLLGAMVLAYVLVVVRKENVFLVLLLLLILFSGAYSLGVVIHAPIRAIN